MGKWKCRICGYVYDEEIGETSSGTAKGTIFDDLPADWTCPVCLAVKDAFKSISLEDVHVKSPTTVSDVLISELEGWGVRLIFGIPGSSSLGLVDALRKNKNVRYVVVRHEENAALAASAYNKLTGNIAGCVTIAGPGATNLSTGLYDAKEDEASVISINGQVNTQYTGPGGVQELDLDAFFRTVSVYNNTIYDKKMAVLLLTKAMKFAILKRGVSQLSVPNDIQKEPLLSSCCLKETCISDFHIIPEDSRIEEAADVINRSENPVILAGWGAFEVPREVLSLARKISAPVVTTYRAKGILPYDNEWLIGTLGNVGSPHARDLVNDSDLLIVLGVGFSRFTNVPLDKKMVQIDINPVILGKNEQSTALWGNCKLVLPLLTQKLKVREDDTITDKIARMKQEWLDVLDNEAADTSVPIRPPYIMKVLSDVIPEDAIISVDVGDNQWWFGRNFRIRRQKFVMSGYLATMGFGLSGAIAGKLAYPDKSVFCITGDGGFSMAMADFVTAVKYELPMVVLVLNNRQLGMIRVEQLIENYQNYATELTNPDFAAYADACGGVGIKVEKPEDLQPAVEKAISLNRPVIVDVNTDHRRVV